MILLRADKLADKLIAEARCPLRRIKAWDTLDGLAKSRRAC
jgi:hypothetical protein